MIRAATVVLLLGVVAAPAAGAAIEDPYPLIRQLMSESKSARKSAARALIAGGSRSLVPALTDAVFFTPSANRQQLFQVLQKLTGESHDGFYEWVEYVGAHGEVEPAAGYFDWKVSLLERIDPRYRRVFYDGAPRRIRLEEIVSGGVRFAGIPALDHPPVVTASEAGFMRDGERIFGVYLGGRARAYPVRVLSWHEMLNDEVGGEPVTLSFCTLCGSGILYSTRRPGGGADAFDTSGLLYRSNKLMVDRESLTLWSNLTGEPVIGRRARGDARLEVLASTLTTWGEWRRRHPQTDVLEVPALTDRGSRFGFVYREGAADQARSGVAFPVWQRSQRLEQGAEIYAIRVDGAVKAYPMETVLERRVINDRLGGQSLVLVGDPESGAVRAYRRSELTFRPADEPGRLADASGRLWRINEEGLVPETGEATLETFVRLPGHVAFWFGWYAFYPQTEVYDGT